MARRSIPQEEIAALLAAADDSDHTSVAAFYLRKFREEFSSKADANAYAFFHDDENPVLAGVGYEDEWSGLRSLPDKHEANARGRVSFASPHVAGAVAAERSGISELQLVLASHTIGVWAGRRTLGYATAHSGGLVLDSARFDGGGVFLARPVRVPVMGAVRFEMHLSKIDNLLNRNNAQTKVEPYFWTARISVQPSDRLRLGLSRGMMFGGKTNFPITFKRVFDNLIGKYTENDEGAFANQVNSVDVKYRVGSRTFPAVLYIDWGADDAYGGWWRVPAIAGGLELGPFAGSDVSFGLERTEFVRNLTTNSLWYQNVWFRGSWADDGVLLGNPLAGHGQEWRAFVSGGAPHRGISAELSAYRRWRGVQNLFGPEREGHSLGGTIDGDARINRAARVVVHAEAERGTDGTKWFTARAQLGVRYRL